MTSKLEVNVHTQYSNEILRGEMCLIIIICKLQKNDPKIGLIFLMQTMIYFWFGG